MSKSSYQFTNRGHGPILVSTARYLATKSKMAIYQIAISNLINNLRYVALWKWYISIEISDITNMVGVLSLVVYSKVVSVSRFSKNLIVPKRAVVLLHSFESDTVSVRVQKIE